MKFVSDDKRAQRRLEKVVTAANKPMYVAVGVLQDEKRDDGFSMVDLAMVHEYGSKDGHIPERSFIRSSCDTKRKVHLRLLRRLEKKVILGHLNKKQALTQIGEMVKSDMVQAINSGIDPALDPKTIRRKKSSKPLIDTGRLKGSIAHEVRCDAI
jgi:phage gpG-like protein